MNTCVIVPSAGTGSRMNNGIKKPYIELNGLPLLAYSLKVFSRLSIIKQIIIPVFPGEEDLCACEVVGKLDLRVKVDIIAGGETRQDSVRNALDQVDEVCECVLVHDGARPFISLMKIKECIETTVKKQATTLGLPVKDTISEVSEFDSTVVKTIPRKQLYSIQTPQTFLKNVIVHAHSRALADGFQGTDDASLVQRLGIPVTVIMGFYENIKITTQEDLFLAEMFLKAGGGTDEKV